MMIDVHLTDGHTVFRFWKRGNLIPLLKQDVTEIDHARGVRCWARWHPGEDFEPCRVMSVRKNSIMFTREITGSERVEFEAKYTYMKLGEDETPETSELVGNESQ